MSIPVSALGCAKRLRASSESSDQPNQLFTGVRNVQPRGIRTSPPNLGAPTSMPVVSDGQRCGAGGQRRGDPEAGISEIRPFLGIEPTEHDSECALVKSGEIDADTNGSSGSFG